MTLMWVSALWASAQTQIVRAQDAAPPPAATPTPEQTVSTLITTLRNSGGRPEDQLKRDEAAQKLVNGFLQDNTNPGLRDNLRNALLDVVRDTTNDGAQRAVASALAADPQAPPPEFVDPLMNLLGRNRALSEAAANALARYAGDDRVINALISFINNQQSGYEASRAGVIRAMGSIIDKRVAAALMQLLDRDTNGQIQDAITDALGDISSLNFGRDTARWRDWWNNNRNVQDGVWRQQQILRRAEQQPVTERRLNDLIQQVRQEMSAHFSATPDAQKAALLMSYLKNPNPTFRAEGARLISEMFQNGNAPNETLKAQLRSMIGDVDPEVRIQVAKTLGDLNDTDARAPLLAQVESEKEPQVQAAIARALGPMHDLQSVPVLLRLLDSSSDRVAEAAALALADPTMSAAVRQDVKLRDQVYNQVVNISLPRTNRPGAENLRKALCEALGGLHYFRALDDLRHLSSPAAPQNTAPVRRAAAVGLGNVEDPPGMHGQVTGPAADTLATVAANDPDIGVQLAAVQALKKVGNFQQVGPLFKLLSGNGRAVDKDVSAAAWDVIVPLINGPDASIDQLEFFLDQLRNEFQDSTAEEKASRELEISKAIAKQLIASNNEPRLAGVKENIGNLLMTLNKPQDAIPYYDWAFNYYLRHNANKAVLQTQVKNLEQVYLVAKRFGDAVNFANERMKADPTMQEILDEQIDRQLSHLIDAKDFSAARELANAVETKLEPKLGGPFRDQFERLRQAIPAE